MNAILVTTNEVSKSSNADSQPTSNSSAPADFLSSFLKSCRIQGGDIHPWILTAPWGFNVVTTDPCFLIVLEGRSLLQFAGKSQELTLVKNDFVVFTRDTDLELRDRPGSRTVVVNPLKKTANSTIGELPRQSAGRAATRLLWGSLDLEDDFTRQAFSLLPPYLLAHGDGPDAARGLDLLLRVLLDEFESRRPGGQLLVNQVLHSLLVIAMRATPQTILHSEDNAPVVGVPGLGMALAAIHTHPDRNWTVQDLAETAGLSRSKFAIRFLKVVGCPPFDYLRDVRMRLACRLLHETDFGIKEIAAQVGYATEASFSKAFSTRQGFAPGAYRRQKRMSASSD